jgi:hypothetical protein
MKKSSAHSRTKSAQRVTNSGPRRLPIFSLDVGYGYTKIMDPSGPSISSRLSWLLVILGPLI